MTMKFKAGDRVVVSAVGGGLFNLENSGASGTVHARRDEETVYVRFDNSDLDYGRDRDLTLLEEVKAPETTTVKEKIEQIEKLLAEIKATLY